MEINEVMHEATHIEDGNYDIPIHLHDIVFENNSLIVSMEGRVLGELITEFINFFDIYNVSRYSDGLSRETCVYLKLGTSRIQVPCSIVRHHVEIGEIDVTTIDSTERQFIRSGQDELNFTIGIHMNNIQNTVFPEKEKKCNNYWILRFYAL